jgi:hypothetical protein
MLRRVIIGDIAATLVDLSIRRLLRVEEQSGGGQTDWLVSPLHSTAPWHRRESLLRYERILLRELARSGPAASLSSLAPRTPGVLELAPRIPQALGAARAALIGDAVHRGWLRRLHHDQRTEAGEQLAARIRFFQHGLRQLATEQGEDALTGPLLPYALHFGMIHSDQLPLAAFARRWVETFAALPGWHLPAPKPSSPLDDPVPINNDWPGSRRYWAGW